ncbi:MAG: hypothetical protein NZT92_15265 [Abditibacteriales bacterium]|nr:hypothetical protein [Abditibacteriales bacterium]
MGTVGVVLVGGVLGGWITYLRSPYRIFRQFIAAVERKDVDTIYSLILDEEKAKMGVTKEVIRRALEGTLYRHAVRIRAVPSEFDHLYGYKADGWYLREVDWLDATTGKYLPSETPLRKCATDIDIFHPPSEGSWRVSFTRFIGSYLAINYAVPRLQRKGTPSMQDIEQARAYSRRWRAQFGMTDVFPDLAITKVKGRWIVLWGQKAEGQ